MVLGMLMLLAFLLAKFIERTAEDMVLEAKTSDISLLRREAYSAMEVTLATLAEFTDMDGGLYRASQGWGNPLEYAGYKAPDGLTVVVQFEDESGKISLPSVTPDRLIGLFKASGLGQADAGEGGGCFARLDTKGLRARQFPSGCR